MFSRNLLWEEATPPPDEPASGLAELPSSSKVGTIAASSRSPWKAGAGRDGIAIGAAMAPMGALGCAFGVYINKYRGRGIWEAPCDDEEDPFLDLNMGKIRRCLLLSDQEVTDRSPNLVGPF